MFSWELVASQCVMFYIKITSGKLDSAMGLIGYSLLSIGFLMEFFGKLMYLQLIIGGLWEITFGIRLIARLEKSSKFNQ